MKTKKCGVYAALAAVLLVMAMLVTTCTDPIIPGGLALKDGEKVFTPPPGKALLKVIIPSEPARTLLPTAPTGAVFYDVHILPFTGETGLDSYGNAEKETPTTLPGVGANIWVVKPGKYDITVFAYIAAANPANNPEGNPFAVFQDLEKTISGTTASSNAVMAPIVDDDTEGTFDYAITLPTLPAAALPDTATLTLTPVGIGTAVGPVNLLASGATTDELTVNSGYYRLAVKLAKKKYGTVTYSHIVHIYGNQTTEWKGSDATLAMSRIAWDVTINANGGTLSSPAAANYDNSGNGWINAGYVTKPSGTFEPTPVNAGEEVLTWHTSPSGTLVTLWDFPTEKIYENVTLYPQYGVPPTTTDLTVTITAYVDPEDSSFSFQGNSTGSIAWSDVPASQNISVTVAAPLNNGVWWYGDVSLETATLNNTAIGTYNSTSGLTDEEKIDLTVADKWYEFMYVTGSGSTLRSATYTIKIGSK